MKRLLLFIIITSCAGLALAQDVIALKNGEHIADVFVSSKTETEIQYIQNEEILSVPRDSVEAIIYENGNLETLSPDLSPDVQFLALIDSIGLDIRYVKQQLDNGVTLQNISWALWQDKSYPKKCRDIGNNAFIKTYSEVYQLALKNAKREGYKGKEAIEKATQEAMYSKFPMKVANETVRRCAGEL
jgi:hypothetical protein